MSFISHKRSSPDYFLGNLCHTRLLGAAGVLLHHHLLPRKHRRSWMDATSSSSTNSTQNTWVRTKFLSILFNLQGFWVYFYSLSVFGSAAAAVKLDSHSASYFGYSVYVSISISRRVPALPRQKHGALLSVDICSGNTLQPLLTFICICKMSRETRSMSFSLCHCGVTEGGIIYLLCDFFSLTGNQRLT